ncbi:MAG TPA: hypothetical protein VM344_00810, partial [Vitreimonas sp.]|nr:hypothetical protein [Vitreimonas sp.]
MNPQPPRSPSPEPDWSDEPRSWEPPAPRPSPLWQSARFAGLLGVALASLLVVAVLLPGLDRPPPGRPGQSPSGSVAVEVPTASPAPSFVRPTPTPAPTFLSYLVQSGDSLNSIGRRFETTARSIAFWNRDTYPSLDPESEQYEPDRIGVGWRLVLLPGVTYGEDDTPAPTPRATPVGPATAPPTARPATPP